MKPVVDLAPNFNALIIVCEKIPVRAVSWFFQQRWHIGQIIFVFGVPISNFKFKINVFFMLEVSRNIGILPYVLSIPMIIIEI